MSDDEGSISKIHDDEITDFKLKAAYRTYSQLFDDIEEMVERRKLNDLMSRLVNEEIGFQQFYGEINRYKENVSQSRRFHRTSIRGQRKRAYRRDQQEKERIRRHKR